MTARRLASAAAALSLAGAAMLGMSAPAVAQTAPYPPAPTAPAGISDATVTPGQEVTANSGSGSFTAGSQVDVRVLGISETRTADATGNVSFTFRVPEGTAPGRYSVVFANEQNRVEVPFTVVAAQAADPGRGQLPLTGSDQLVPLTVAGVALVGIGAGIVVASRRRRETLPGGLA